MNDKQPPVNDLHPPDYGRGGACIAGALQGNGWLVMGEPLQCVRHRRAGPLAKEFHLPGKIEGKIVAVSESGNLVSDISEERLSRTPRDGQLTVRCDEHETIGIFASGHDQPSMTLIAVVGSSGNLELEIVGESAKIMLGIAVGEPVVVKW